jgi:hypothetical protein
VPQPFWHEALPSILAAHNGIVAELMRALHKSALALIDAGTV